jgi:hypothetical protein
LDLIIDRLAPYAAAVGDLVLELVSTDPASRVGSVLQIVRCFDEAAGEEEEPSVIEMPNGGQLEKMPGQHQLLSWHLSPTVIDFLSATHASLDFDEYG